MEPLTLIILAIIAYLIFGRSGLTIGGQIFGPGTSSNIPAQGQVVSASPIVGQQLQAEYSSAQAGVSAGVSTASSALRAVGAAGGLVKAVPVVGAIIGGLIDAFAAASAKRASQARDENSAVAAAVPGWDQAMAQIAQYYNSGQLSATDVNNAVDAIWQNFWNETGPRIQPGRDGCQSGKVVQAPTQTFCGGKTYGAACCVGYDDLKNSNNNVKNAVKQTENTGAPANAYILPVFASKYGGINRPGYTLTFKKSQPLFRL
jgi:hypothetical protein